MQPVAITVDGLTRHSTTPLGQGGNAKENANREPEPGRKDRQGTTPVLPLRQGVWGNTWGEWVQVVASLVTLWGCAAGLFALLLVVAGAIRGSNYLTLTTSEFGPFDRTPVPSNHPGISLGPRRTFNPPQGCTPQEALQEFSVEGTTVRIEVANGIQQCRNQAGDWTVFPWVIQSQGLGLYCGCATPQGSPSTLDSYIAASTSPAYIPTPAPGVNASQALAQTWVCQNFLPDQAAGWPAACA